jgi:DNA ligase (NAD+)
MISGVSHQVIAVTGELENMTRQQVAERIKQAGGVFSNRVTKQTTLLVKGSRSGSHKPRQASSVGAAVIDEIDFMQMLGAAHTRRLPGLLVEIR